MKKSQEKISMTLDASPESTWKVIGAIDGVDQWFGSFITSCSVDNGKRFCETKEGIKFQEDILEVNHQEMRFQFAIPVQDMLPVENIVETMQVTDENGKAVVSWSATFDTSIENEAIAKEAFRSLWTMGLKEMESFINKN